MAARSRRFWQLRVQIKGTQPPVWRRVLVSDNSTLLDLHFVLQDCLGWQDYHLHEYTVRGVRYSDPDNDEYGIMDLQDDSKMRLRDLGLEPGEHFSYVYDFGDGWQHVLWLEEILPAENRTRLPICLGGARACPPEDVGGVGGYAEFLRALADPDHPEHATYRRWIGGSFDPEAFDLQDANERLRRGARRRRAPQWDFAANAVFTPSHDTAAASAEHEATAEGLPLRRDILTLLVYLREHKVTGTQSTGNLPLKAVADVAAGFVEPPVLQHDIGGRIYRFRSEEEVRPVYFVHLLARGADLVDGGPALRWRLTPRAEAFFSASAATQVLLLFRAWWNRFDWSLIVPFSIIGDDLLPTFQETLLSLLRTMPSGQWAEFDPFIDRMIAEARWTWSEPPAFNVRDRIASSVEHTAIRPLEQFGVLSTRSAKVEGETEGFLGWPKLAAISLTAFGRMLLDLCFQAGGLRPLGK